MEGGGAQGKHDLSGESGGGPSGAGNDIAFYRAGTGGVGGFREALTEGDFVSVAIGGEVKDIDDTTGFGAGPLAGSPLPGFLRAYKVPLPHRGAVIVNGAVMEGGCAGGKFNESGFAGGIANGAGSPVTNGGAETGGIGRPARGLTEGDGEAAVLGGEVEDVNDGATLRAGPLTGDGLREGVEGERGSKQRKRSKRQARHDHLLPRTGKWSFRRFEYSAGDAGNRGGETGG